MNQTTNYNLKLYEGTDLFNPLTVENVNVNDLDGIVKGVSDAAVGTATELLTGTVHALTRNDPDRNVITFTATSNFTAGETFTVDGVQVTALTPDGQTLATGCYIIGSEVLAILKATLLTVYVGASKAKDSDKLDGHDSTYFATATDLTDLDNDVDAISTKVGTEVLQTTAPDLSGAVNELHNKLAVSQDEATLPLTWSSGDNNGKVYFRKSGNVVCMWFYNLSILQVGNVSNLFTIPAGFRPSSTQYVTFCEIPTSGTRSITLTLSPSGQVDATTRGTTGALNISGVTATYVM